MMVFARISPVSIPNPRLLLLLLLLETAGGIGSVCEVICVQLTSDDQTAGLWLRPSTISALLLRGLERAAVLVPNIR